MRLHRQYHIRVMHVTVDGTKLFLYVGTTASIFEPLVLRIGCTTRLRFNFSRGRGRCEASQPTSGWGTTNYGSPYTVMRWSWYVPPIGDLRFSHLPLPLVDLGIYVCR